MARSDPARNCLDLERSCPAVVYIHRPLGLYGLLCVSAAHAFLSHPAQPSLVAAAGQIDQPIVGKCSI